jgi:NADPH:quinone reductase-like Zn-dependent oxidoreductase
VNFFLPNVLVRTTAAGVTPLDYTILSGSFPKAKAPLVLGNEGAGVVEGSGDDQFPDGSRAHTASLKTERSVNGLR